MAKKMSFGGKEADPRKAAAPKRSKKSSLSIKAKAPLDSMSAGAASSLPMPPAAGLRPGMKKGGLWSTEPAHASGSFPRN